MKKILLAMVLSLASMTAFAGGTVSGQFTVSLTILPNAGCSGTVCAIDTKKISESLNKKNSSDNFNVSKKDNVITVEF